MTELIVCNLSISAAYLLFDRNFTLSVHLSAKQDSTLMPPGCEISFDVRRLHVGALYHRLKLLNSKCPALRVASPTRVSGSSSFFIES